MHVAERRLSFGQEAEVIFLAALSQHMMVAARVSEAALIDVRPKVLPQEVEEAAAASVMVEAWVQPEAEVYTLQTGEHEALGQKQVGLRRTHCLIWASLWLMGQHLQLLVQVVPEPMLHRIALCCP